MLENKQQEALVCLMEESAEIITSCSKLLRFGTTKENLNNLFQEVADVLVNIELTMEIFNHEELVQNKQVITLEQMAYDKVDNMKLYTKYLNDELDLVNNDIGEYLS